jgi:hypothetical protein
MLEGLVLPKYPLLARQARIEGDVILGLSVDQAGRLTPSIVPGGPRTARSVRLLLHRVFNWIAVLQIYSFRNRVLAFTTTREMICWTISSILPSSNSTRASLIFPAAQAWELK